MNHQNFLASLFFLFCLNTTLLLHSMQNPENNNKQEQEKKDPNPEKTDNVIPPIQDNHFLKTEATNEKKEKTDQVLTIQTNQEKKAEALQALLDQSPKSPKRRSSSNPQNSQQKETPISLFLKNTDVLPKRKDSSGYFNSLWSLGTKTYQLIQKNVLEQHVATLEQETKNLPDSFCAFDAKKKYTNQELLELLHYQRSFSRAIGALIEESPDKETQFDGIKNMDSFSTVMSIMKRLAIIPGPLEKYVIERTLSHLEKQAEKRTQDLNKYTEGIRKTKEQINEQGNN